MRLILILFIFLTSYTSLCFSQAKGKKPTSDNKSSQNVKEKTVYDEREFKSDYNTMLLFHFNESSSTVISDASGNSNNGYTTGTNITTGKFGNARYFNGRNDFITIKNSSSLSNLNYLTIEAWVMPTNFDLSCWSNAEDILTKGKDSQKGRPDGFGLRIERNSNSECGEVKSFIQFKIDFDFGGVGCGTKWFEPNQWYYIAATYDGNYLKIYINGTLEATSDYAPNLNVLTKDNIFINHHEWEGGQSSQRMVGIIDELRISNIARTEDEIINYYNLVANNNSNNINLNLNLNKTIDINKSIYFISIDRTVYIKQFQCDIQNEPSSYVGTYTWLMNRADDENNGSWEELIIKSINGNVSAYSIFYTEAEPNPVQNMNDVSISGNSFNSKILNSYENKYSSFNGRFVYVDIKNKNGTSIRINGLLIEEGPEGIVFYEKSSK